MGCTSLRTRDHGCCLVSTWNPRACRDCVVIRAHGCPGVITVDLDRTQEVAGSIPASSTLRTVSVLDCRPEPPRSRWGKTPLDD
jgi:hypothetical protein